MKELLATRKVILGTAGHIDHGKTALVRAMTGVDTDRLPEEKKRGMTIDIGFASLDLGHTRLGIVDVPGHERFIKNMLAGASGIDIALLVVAADDSVMPQTREHLDILRLLDIQVGVIAITKIDLPDPDWLDLVQEDVWELVKGTFLENAPIVRTSATTGQGLDTLKSALAETCHRIQTRRTSSQFRLAVDRAFVMQGHGTVITGTVWSGSAQVGDALDWQPAGQTVRIKSLHSHGQDIEQIQQGQRAAIGLTGVHHSEVVRGDEMASPGFLRASRLMTVQLRVLNSSPWPIKHKARVRLHIGTKQVMASVSLLANDCALPGQTVPAQLTLATPTTAVCGQPFVIRSESPLLTIGGGHVLQPITRRIRRTQVDLIQRVKTLADDDPITRADCALYFFGLRDWSDMEMCRNANIQMAQVATIKTIELPISPTRTARLHPDIYENTQSQLVAAVAAYHQAHPLHAGIPHPQLSAAIGRIDAPLLRAIISKLIREDILAGNEHLAHIPGFSPNLNHAQKELLAHIISTFLNAAYQPPGVEELVHEQSTPATVKQLVDLAAGQDLLVHLGGGLYLHAQHERAMRQKIADRFNHVSSLTVAQIRDLLGTSRKFAVPICEYLDRVGSTRRKGDVRIAGQAKDSLP